MTEKELFEIVSRAWRSLKGGEIKIAPGVEAYEFWPGSYLPYIDWRYLKEPSTDLVSKIIEYSKNREIKAYFNMLESRRDEGTELAESLGMKFEHSMSFAINTKNFIGDDLPEYEYDIAPLDSHLFEEYSKLTMDIFGFSDDKITKGNRDFFKKYPNENRVLIMRSNGEAIGTGCFCVNDGVGWFFGGAVYPKFQGNKFGKAILFELMNESAKLGATVWFSQTQHEKVMKMADYTVGLDTYSFPDGIETSWE